MFSVHIFPYNLIQMKLKSIFDLFLIVQLLNHLQDLCGAVIEVYIYIDFLSNLKIFIGPINSSNMTYMVLYMHS